ncbi:MULTISPECIES: hypothetical protein [Cryobacterium]|uniref:Uncharacterized protein n=1 Tax=Cryobacterium glucosi TaxID=1259175 RepID=A0ABY2IQZ3_9MICO|nr:MULTISPECIES: hypothetical protein [Cryobacterium]MDY7528684.1 hypothetical protein [Cryobacterium sp. 10C2]MDY7555575.1 hypothetical protein [Cryobacterium sp. 10C3]MEB0001878.1 hypothetical protein [Cryobacterium sp. RTC2.1]MEB0202920.1 hypothetical protein [Cryobacterium sp. 5I3]MEB0287099.1 hypothetical protein [Cryobacterium sp. 10S3]
MTTTLSTTAGRHDHPLHPQPEPDPHSGSERASADRNLRPLGRIDRLALHLGVALIRWGRRPRVQRPVAAVDWEAVRLVREERERALERQHADLLRYRMTTPYR